MESNGRNDSIHTLHLNKNRKLLLCLEAQRKVLHPYLFHPIEKDVHSLLPHLNTHICYPVWLQGILHLFFMSYPLRVLKELIFHNLLDIALIIIDLSYVFGVLLEPV